MKRNHRRWLWATVMVVSLGALIIGAVSADDRVAKTPQEIAALSARVSPWIEVSYLDDEGRRQERHGSGIFLNKKGMILTNAHVALVEPDTWKWGPRSPSATPHKVIGTDFRYKVFLPWANEEFVASRLSWCPYRDLALLQTKGIPSALYDVPVFGQSSDLQVGDPVWTFGNPLDLAETFTAGIISALGRNTGLNYCESSIQHTATIAGGSSGSPLFDQHGDVVGVNFAYIGHYELAIPIEFFDKDMFFGADDEIEMNWLGLEIPSDNFAHGRTVRGLQKLEQLSGFEDALQLQRLFEITKKYGAIVSEVVEDSPAAKAGLKRGDVIMRVNDVEVKDGMAMRLVQMRAVKGALLCLGVKRVDIGDDGSIFEQDLNLPLIFAEAPKPKKA